MIKQIKSLQNILLLVGVGVQGKGSKKDIGYVSI